MSLDNFLRDLWPKQILIQTGKHTLKYQTAKVLTTRPPRKQNLFNETKFTLAPMLWLNMH